jgi:hypothetical protein
MVKKLSLKIQDESYKKLESLSDFFKQDTRQIITSILEGLSTESDSLIDRGRKYRVPVNIEEVLRRTLWEVRSGASFFSYIPEKLKVGGLFWLDDFECDLDKDYFMFHYSSLPGCNLDIDSFHLTMEPGSKTLYADIFIDVNETNKQSLDKLKEVVKHFQPPSSFDALEDFDINILGEDEEIWTIEISCTAETLHDLPSIEQLNRIMKKIIRKVGIRQKD